MLEGQPATVEVVPGRGSRDGRKNSRRPPDVMAIFGILLPGSRRIGVSGDWRSAAQRREGEIFANVRGRLSWRNGEHGNNICLGTHTGWL